MDEGTSLNRIRDQLNFERNSERVGKSCNERQGNEEIKETKILD